MTLLLVASTRSDLPAWGGPLDVVVAFTLIATAFLIWRRAGDRAGVREFRIGHGVAAIVPALALAWLVLYTIPSALALVGRPRIAS